MSTHIGAPPKGGWLFYIVRCSCGDKFKGWTADGAEQKQKEHAKEADK